MSKTEILDELPRLTPEDRLEIRLCLAKLDQDYGLDDDELTAEEKAEIERRIADLEKNPTVSSPWAVAEARLTVRFGR